MPRDIRKVIPVDAAGALLDLALGGSKSLGDLYTRLGDGSQTTKVRDSAGLVIDPAREGGNLATLAGKDFATQATLAAVLAKLTADPATQTTLAALLAQHDLTVSQLRDALRGPSARNLSELWDLQDAIRQAVARIPANPAQEDGNLAASAASLATVAGWNEGGRGKANLIPGQAGVDGGAGAATSKTLRVVNALPTREYSASRGPFGIPSGATDIAVLRGPSSSATIVRARRAWFSGHAASAVALTVAIIKRSTPNGSAVFENPTPVPYDPQMPASSALVTTWTSVPASLGTAVGTVAAKKHVLHSSSTPATGAGLAEFTFPGGGIVLRTRDEMLAINLGGATITTGSAAIGFDWSEEAT
jgi:hypothetical protein